MLASYRLRFCVSGQGGQAAAVVIAGVKRFLDRRVWGGVPGYLLTQCATEAQGVGQRVLCSMESRADSE